MTLSSRRTITAFIVVTAVLLLALILGGFSPLVSAGSQLRLAEPVSDYARFARQEPATTIAYIATVTPTPINSPTSSPTPIYESASPLAACNSDFSFERSWGKTGSAQAEFQAPVSIAIDLDGNVHVAELGNERIQKFDSQGLPLTVYPSLQGRVIKPNGIGLGPRGYIYVADTERQRVLFYTKDGVEIGSWNDTGESWMWYKPWGVAGADWATDGTVYVVDKYYCKVYRFRRTGDYIGSRGYCSSSEGYMQSPRDVAVFHVSRFEYPVIYIADTGNNRIQKRYGNLDWITEWGSSGAGDGQFNQPSAVATDYRGCVYVADTENHRIQIFDSEGDFVTRFGVQGQGSGQLQSPLGLDVHQDGCVYVADTGNNRISMFCPQNVLPTYTPIPPTPTPTTRPTRTPTPTPTATATATVTPTPEYLVSGTITDSLGNAVPGVKIYDGEGLVVVTNTNGRFKLTYHSPVTRVITPSLSDYTFVPKTIAVTVPPNDLNVDFKAYDRPPIVMVHGWRGLLPYPVGSCDPADPDDYFQSTDDLLKAAGYHVEYALLETSACYTPPIEENVPNLENAIAAAKAKTSQNKVILIGHSMGGLVSRAYVEGNAYADDVLQLFTFGSPHHGTSASLLTHFANLATLGTFCGDLQPATCDFSVTGMLLFNRDHTPRIRVIYHLISGDAPFYSRSAAGLVTDMLIAGSDDGVVPTESGLGRYLENIFEHWTTDEVHGPANEGAFAMGSDTYFTRDSGQSVSYTQCLKPILVDEYTVRCIGSGVVQAVSKSPMPATRLPLQFGEISSGETISQAIPIDEMGPAMFAASLPGGTLSVSLVDPDGKVIDSEYAADHPSEVDYRSDDSTVVYTLLSTKAGIWQLNLQATNVPAAGGNYATLVSLQSELTMTANTDKQWYKPGASAELEVNLSPLPASANVDKTISFANGSQTDISLISVGDGKYETSFIVPNVPGYAEVRVVASGTTTQDFTFERGAILLFQVAAGTVTLRDDYSEVPVRRWPNTDWYQALDIGVGVDVHETIKFGLSADLEDGDGNVVAHALAYEELSSGKREVRLRFAGEDIFASKLDGPYTLTNLLLTDKSGATLIISEADSVYTTADYKYQQFGTSDVYLPLTLDIK